MAISIFTILVPHVVDIFTEENLKNQVLRFLLFKQLSVQVTTIISEIFQSRYLLLKYTYVGNCTAEICQQQGS